MAHRAALLVPPVRRLRDERDAAAAALATASIDQGTAAGNVAVYPPGHFYSPIPSKGDVDRALASLGARRLPGVDLRTEVQLDVLSELAPLVHDSPFAREEPDAAQRGHRYHLDNPFFGPTDGLIAQAFLRSRKPPRVVEVGSGFSSALMLDVDDLYLDRRTRFTFVDPHPQRLESLLAAGDESGDRVTILRHEVQDVDLAIFDELEPGDLLFVDSSHVVGTGSDVNLLLLEVVPALKPGILVHIHDVGWPFEYSRDWLEEGRFWSEAYLLQALLVGNAGLAVELWMGQLLVEQNDQVASRTPELADPAVGWGTSVWLRTR
jgi:hypothetical protein